MRRGYTDQYNTSQCHYYVVKYGLHRNTVLLVNGILFRVLVYCSRSCMSGRPLTLTVQARVTVCMECPIRRSTRAWQNLVRPHCAPPQPECMGSFSLEENTSHSGGTTRLAGLVQTVGVLCNEEVFTHL
jgi:hypothetical protein